MAMRTRSPPPSPSLRRSSTRSTQPACTSRASHIVESASHDSRRISVFSASTNSGAAEALGDDGVLADAAPTAAAAPTSIAGGGRKKSPLHALSPEDAAERAEASPTRGEPDRAGLLALLRVDSCWCVAPRRAEEGAASSGRARADMMLSEPPIRTSLAAGALVTRRVQPRRASRKVLFLAVPFPSNKHRLACLQVRS